MSFLKKKNITNENEKLSGIVVQSTPVINDRRNRLAFCLTNALLLFLVTEGCIGCFMTAFDIPVNMYIVTVFNFTISIIYSMFYYNKLIKILGYLAVLGTFAYIMINYGIIVRSGFGAMTNILMAYIEDVLDLPVQREYTEYYTNRDISMTLCIIVIIIATGLMFNIIISEVKGSLFLFITTFPIVQLGLYFEEQVEVKYFLMYLAAMITISLFRGTSHYKLETKKKKGYIEKVKGNLRKYDYVSDGRTDLKQMASYGIIIMVIISVISVIIPQKSFRMSTEYDSLKDDTNELAKQIALVGLYGLLFDGSSGGVSRNKLGDAKYVQYDFQTDLVLSMPASDNIGDLYFKGYTGTIYDDNSWKTNEEMNIENSDSDINANYNELGENIYYEMAKYNPRIPSFITKLSNVGANPTYIYNQYYGMDMYSIYDDVSREDDPRGRFDYGQTIRTGNLYWDSETSYNTAVEMADEFYNDHKNDDDMKFTYKIEEEYRDYVYKTYLDVPQENSEVIQKIIDDYDIDKQNDVVEAVKEFLENNYEYSLIPGKTPRGSDFVNYFLTENKKGYCTYFASSAVLMFRELGIPARYVGGYHVSSSDLSDSTVLDEEKYSEWYVNGSDDNDVVELEINDSSAHAWTEVYIDRFGWIPVEVTPPSDEDETEDIEETQSQSAISRFMTTLFSPQTARNVRNTTSYICMIIGVMLVIAAVLYFIAGYLLRYIRRISFTKHKDKRKTIFMMNRYVYRMFGVLGYKKMDHESFGEYMDRVAKAGIVDETVCTKLLNIYEKAKFSGQMVRDCESEEFMKLLYKVRYNVYTSLKWYKKIMFKFILML